MVQLDNNLLMTVNSAIASHRAGKLAEAESLYKSVLAAKPDQFEALHFLGLIEAQRGNLAEADRLIAKSLAVNSQRAEAYTNHARILINLERAEDALASCDKALALQPYFADAMIHRGNALQMLWRLEEAVAAFDLALTMQPNNIFALTNRGHALSRLNRPDRALASFDKVIALQPDFVDAQYGRGRALFQLERYEDAAVTFRKVHGLTPTPEHRIALMQSKSHVCDWSDFSDDLAFLSAELKNEASNLDPGFLIAMTSQAHDHLICAQRFARRFYPAAADPLCRGPRQQRDRIRLGYVCSEFRQHAVSHLIAGLFEHHDKARFETFAISTGVNDQSAMRKRIEAAFDVFIEGQLKSDRELAELLNRSEIDILVNLSGYYGVERAGIFALRPCPVQVNYLGYPGTMGAEYIDYIIADETIIPADQQSAYSEKVVYLPECYQVNDSHRRASLRALSRVEAGLPPSGLVFCCFNKNNKILPDTFDSWARILQRVEGSVLWLLEGSAAAVRNLRQEAESRGIAAERLVFAPWVPAEDHLARYRLADLFLDTLPYNAHTTASDALWAGVPVLTCLGSTFAGRVGASLLQAIGLPELITHSTEEYESLAVRLAADPNALATFKSRLAQNRDTHPLFDTSRFCRHIERAYITMWQRSQRGEPATSFAIDPDPAAGTLSASPTQRG